MIIAALRDLVWRRKRFAIAVAATALVFGMSVLMSGLAEAFPNEVHRMIDRIGGEGFIAGKGEPGPFTTTKIALQTDVKGDAVPMIFDETAVHAHGKFQTVAIFGLPIGRDVHVTRGRAPQRAGEMVVDGTLGAPIGSVVDVSGARETVVGHTSGATLFGGQPVLFMPIADLQKSLAQGLPITRTWIVDGPNVTMPSNEERFTRSQAGDDLLRPLQSANSAIDFIKFLLWIVAACIVGSVVFLSALERVRDFAIFKATGVSTRSIGLALAMQAVLVAVVSSAFAAVVAVVLAPLFPLTIVVPKSAYITLPLLAIVIGLLASLAGMRRAVSVDPAAAFGGR